MIADLFSVLKTTFSTVRKQQTLNFSYHESSRCQFSQENQRGLKAFRTDNLPKRSVGCPWEVRSVPDDKLALNEHEGITQIYTQYNPESEPKFTADPRSTVFSKSASPLDLPQKSTIRALFKAKSVDPKTYSPPSVRLGCPLLWTTKPHLQTYHAS